MTWQPTPAARAGLWLFVAFDLTCAASVIAIAAGDDDLLLGLTAAIAIGVAPAVIAIRAALRLRIVADDQGLRTVHLFSERVLTWDEVVSAEPGYAGIIIKTRGGGQFVAGAVQKTNTAHWLRRRTRADDVAAYLNARAKGHA